jgi:hypothetical protein
MKADIVVLWLVPAFWLHPARPAAARPARPGPARPGRPYFFDESRSLC